MDRMPPPGASHHEMPATIAAGPGKEKMPPPGAMDKVGDGKVSPEEAGVYRSDQTCVQCGHYDPTSGECSKVAGNFDPQDGCMEYFEAIGDDTPPEDDGMPDDDEESGS